MNFMRQTLTRALWLKSLKRIRLALGIVFLLTATLAPAQAASAPALPSFFVGTPGSQAYALESPELHAWFSSSEIVFERHGEALQLRFLGAQASVITGQATLGARINFLNGNNPAEWRTGLPAYATLLYRALYPGIDMTYSVSGSSLKSEFLVAPGALPSLIRLFYSGTVEIGPRGELVVRGQTSELREQAPEIYQDTQAGRKAIEGRFVKVDAHTAGFAIGAYDETLPLVIDPVVSYATYLGGSGIGAVTGLAVDTAGNLYSTGWTEANNFPIVGAYQSNVGGGVDAFVVKFNPAGSALLYATYFGGSADDRASAIAVDSSGQAYVTGATASTNFPTVQAMSGGLSGQTNAFILKLNATGNLPIYSTYLGGAIYDQGTAIATDSSGNAYIGGDTQSLNFPVLNALQSTNAGGTDTFITKLSAAGALTFSTYLGGSGVEHLGGIALDSSNNMYIAGGTYSTNFPAAGPLQAANGGGQDAFVAKISANGSSLVYSTYLGGSGSGGSEQANGIAVDSAGNAYIAGVTNSSNFPVSSGALQSAYAGFEDAFVSKINAAGSALTFSTYLGGFDLDWASAIGLDSNRNVYIAGYTASANFPQVSAVQAAFGGFYDAFVTELSASGIQVTFSSWLGGAATDEANALVVDANGNMFVGGQTNSLNFPLVGAIQSTNNSGSTGWAARLGVTNPPAQQPSAVSVTPASGSGNTVTFTAQYTDTAGPAALTSVALLVNTSFALGFGCYVTYNPAASNFSLFNDNPSTGSQTVVAGGGSQVNDQCQLNGAGSTAAVSGSTLTVTYSLTFQPGFPGAKTIYVYAADSGANTGWIALGNWTVTVPAPSPSVNSVSPNAGLGAGGTFTFVFSDTQSANNLTGMIMLFGPSLQINNVCYVVYDRNAGTIALAYDNGQGSSSRSLSSSAPLSNSQCTVGAATATAAGLFQIISLNLTFSGTFTGTQNVYGYATENGTLNTGYVQIGTFTTAAGGVPMAGGVVPASGTGPAERFGFTIADQGGSSFLTGMAALFSTSVSTTTNACFVSYDRTVNKVSLAYDTLANGSASAVPGAATLLSNSQCTLNVANTTVTIGTTSIVVTFDLTFSAAWFGAKNVYSLAAETGVNSGWVQVGSWTVTGGAPSAISMSPSSGSSASPTLTFTVSDSAVQSNITGMTMLLTGGSPANTTNACYLIYNRLNATVGLYDNTGTVLNTKGIGSSANLNNSQCAVGYAGMTTSGTTVSLMVNLVLNHTPFAGAKSVYLQASEPNANSGWVYIGSWTVP